ncbi:MAG: hypothetical protein ACR2MD_08615 [Aridibacter sp.]
MEEIVLLLSIFVMIAVPISVWITIQYCIHIGKDSGSVKLMLFSMFSTLIVLPFSVLVMASILTSYISGGTEYLIESSTFFTVDLGYMMFGWLVCSAIFGELIVPDISKRKIKLP